jgi:hypothetical protein
MPSSRQSRLTAALFAAMVAVVGGLLTAALAIIQYFGQRPRREKAAAVGSSFAAAVDGLTAPETAKQLAAAVLLRRFFDPSTEQGACGRARVRRYPSWSRSPELQYESRVLGFPTAPCGCCREVSGGLIARASPRRTSPVSASYSPKPTYLMLTCRRRRCVMRRGESSSRGLFWRAHSSLMLNLTAPASQLPLAFQLPWQEYWGQMELLQALPERIWDTTASMSSTWIRSS